MKKAEGLFFVCAERKKPKNVDNSAKNRDKGRGAYRMKKKKYPVLWWGNTVAIMAVWIEIGALVVLCIIGSIIEPPTMGTLLFVIFILVAGVLIEIVCIHYKAKSYILIRPQGVAWRGLFGNRYASFSWEEIRQVGIFWDKGEPGAYFSTWRCETVEKLIEARNDYLGTQAIVLNLSKKKVALFKETVNQYLAPEKWAPDMDKDGNWIPEDGRPVWVPIDEWEADKAEKEDE